MLKLIKYEMRKTRFSKIIIFTLSMLLELFFFIGVFTKNDSIYGPSAIFLSLLAFCGIAYIGIESLVIFQKDLNTKQSYMLFMTPNSSYKILGAKVIENGLSIILSGLYFSLLAVIDVVALITFIGGLKELINACSEFLRVTGNIEIQPKIIFIFFLLTLVSWLTTIVIGELAIVLCATILAGKKFSGFVSFFIFIIIMQLYTLIIRHLPSLKSTDIQCLLIILVSAVITAGAYFVTGWIMDKKLSV